MPIATPPQGLDFPRPEDFVQVLLVPVFIEPMDHSGERICAGVVGYANGRAERTSADHVLRYHCVYGSAVATLEMVADLALRSLQAHLEQSGGAWSDPSTWLAPASGLSLGRVTTTTARSLDEALAHSLVEHAAAVAIDAHQADRGIVGDRYASMSVIRLERQVRDMVIKGHPALAQAFGQQFRVLEGARPLVLGFCGRRLVANFSTLTRKQLSAAVRVSKAKLWDLEQARDGASRGWFKSTPQRFELLLSASGSWGANDSQEPIDQAFAELEYEADRKEIISRRNGDLKSIAEHLVTVESA